MILTLPAHTKLTFMDYLLTFLRILLRYSLQFICTHWGLHHP
jgi:hypothetical protein